MHIVFHAHHADVTDALQQRAAQSVTKLAARLRGTTDASVRFADDGAERRVEIMLRAARRRPLVAEGTGSRYEFALASAVERLGAHVAHVRAERERRRRTRDASRTVGDAAPAANVDDDFGDLLRDAATPPPRPVAGA